MYLDLRLLKCSIVDCYGDSISVTYQAKHYCEKHGRILVDNLSYEYNILNHEQKNTEQVHQDT